MRLFLPALLLQKWTLLLFQFFSCLSFIFLSFEENILNSKLNSKKSISVQNILIFLLHFNFYFIITKIYPIHSFFIPPVRSFFIPPIHAFFIPPIHAFFIPPVHSFSFFADSY